MTCVVSLVSIQKFCLNDCVLWVVCSMFERSSYIGFSLEGDTSFSWWFTRC